MPKGYKKLSKEILISQKRKKKKVRTVKAI
jgi:hypothetical protein